MEVSELLAALNTMDPELEVHVCFNNDDDTFCHVIAVESDGVGAVELVVI